MSPCLTLSHKALPHRDSYGKYISGSLTFLTRRSHWHWESVNVCLAHTLTHTFRIHTLTSPPPACAQIHTYSKPIGRTHRQTHSHQGRWSRERRRDRWLGRGPQGENFEWGAFQMQNRWSNWCWNCRVAGGTRCRQSFGRGRVFGAWISSIKVRGTELKLI